MSSKGRNPSVFGENYETPKWAVRRLLEEIWLPTGFWIEPCAGNGRIVQAVHEDRPESIHFTTVEIRPECKPNLPKGYRYCPVDFLEDFDARKARMLTEGSSYFNVAITNPPFSKSMEMLSKCLVIADYVVMLQRSNWLGGGSHNGKNEFLRGCMPDVYPLPDRLRFLINGEFPRYPDDFGEERLRGKYMPGDSIEYSWYVWGPKETRFREQGIIRNLASTPKDERTKLEVAT